MGSVNHLESEGDFLADLKSPTTPVSPLDLRGTQDWSARNKLAKSATKISTG